MESILTSVVLTDPGVWRMEGQTDGRSHIAYRLSCT